MTRRTVNDDGVRIGPNGTPVEWDEQESYFFKTVSLSRTSSAGALCRQSRTSCCRVSAVNEVRGFVKGGLQDLSISRTSLDWGIPVPDAPGHVMYVWVDALTNYITGTGFPDMESETYKRYWPADLHVIGKDIVRFHAVYWPAFLMSAGLPLPKRVFAHGFLFNRGEKMSKSVGNVVDPFALADHYGVDQMRYYFLREVPFGQDGNYSHEAIVARINADLANDLGNLAQRSLSMVAKHCNASVPACSAFSDADRALLDQAADVLEKNRAAHDKQQIHLALGDIFAVVAEANRYFAGQEPWALRKSDFERMQTVLYVTAEVLRQVGILVQPYMPQAGAKLLDILGVAEDKRQFADLGTPLEPGAALPSPSPVFPRYVEAEMPAAE
jgi:methionyl-tRNA synthetase